MSKTEVCLTSPDSIKHLCDKQKATFRAFTNRDAEGAGNGGNYSSINDVIYDIENITYETYRALVSKLNSFASQPAKINEILEITNDLPLLANAFPILQFTREAINRGFVDENQPSSQIFTDAIKFMKMAKIRKGENVNNIPANLDLQVLEQVITNNFSITKGFVTDELQKQAKLQNALNGANVKDLNQMIGTFGVISRMQNRCYNKGNPKLADQLKWVENVAVSAAVQNQAPDKEIDKSMAAQLINANNEIIFARNINTQFGHGSPGEIKPVENLTEVLTEALNDFSSSPEFGM